MIAIYCSSELGGQLIARYLRGHSLLTTRWSVLEDASLAAEAAVVGFESGTATSVQYFHRFRVRRHALPVVVVANTCASERAVGADSIDEIVPWGQAEHLLWSAVERAREQLPRRRIAVEIQALPYIPSELRRALVHLCRASEPVRTVTELACQIGCSRTKLARLWRSATGRAGALRLEDAVDWVMLLRALRMKTPTDSWRRVSEELGVADYTLGRLGRRLVDCTFAELEEKGHCAAAALFRAVLLQAVARS